MNLHIYTAHIQPATNFLDYTFDPPMGHSYKAHRLLWAHCCGKRRRAENVVVQCYYDGWTFWCAPNHGCKNPDVIAQKFRKTFRNRSAAQKIRWAKHRLKESLK